MFFQSKAQKLLFDTIFYKININDIKNTGFMPSYKSKLKNPYVFIELFKAYNVLLKEVSICQQKKNIILCEVIN